MRGRNADDIARARRLPKDVIARLEGLQCGCESSSDGVPMSRAVTTMLRA